MPGEPARRIALGALALLAAAAPASATAGACPPADYDRGTLRQLRAQHFAIADADRRAALARALLPCLADPDSELRDRIGYEAFAYWRHAKALDATTWREIMRELLARLGAADDAAGVAKPFAALVLAEVVHADHDAPFLDAGARAALLDAAIAYYASLRDYRGFDEQTGWRHGVAHAADLLGELAAEPALARSELERILAALATQVAAAGEHVYVFGESERIAAAAARVARRGLIPAQSWNAWLAGTVAPKPFARWADAWETRAGLAKRQNTMNFLLALYAELAQSDDASLRALAPSVGAALQPLR